MLELTNLISYNSYTPPLACFKYTDDNNIFKFKIRTDKIRQLAFNKNASLVYRDSDTIIMLIIHEDIVNVYFRGYSYKIKYEKCVQAFNVAMNAHIAFLESIANKYDHRFEFSI